MHKQKNVAAIHDLSCYGRCSLTVVLPILSAAGLYTIPIPTALLSTHTAIEGFTYRELTRELEGIADHFSMMNLSFDSLYSGFLGNDRQIDLVMQIFDRFKTSENIVLVDPAMADHGKMYKVYDDRMVEGMKRLLKKGDIIVPNITEAAFILGEEYKEGPYDVRYIENLMDGLMAFGHGMVVLTGVYFDENRLGAVSGKRGEASYSYYFSEHISGHYHGTGDIFASALLAGLMNAFSLEEAVQIAAEYTCKCIEVTLDEGREFSQGVCYEKTIPYLLDQLKKKL